LQQLLLAGQNHDAETLHATLLDRAPFALEELMSRPHVNIAPPVRNKDDSEMAKLCLAEDLAKLESRRAAHRELNEALEDIGGLADEGLTWRISQATNARDRAERTGNTNTTDLGEDRPDLLNQLKMISERIGTKKIH
jgi:DNA primase